MSLEKKNIVDVEISREMRTSFLDYSMSVITARALPDVRDGFKPVHRRILYTMYENGLFPDKAYRKCADTVGTVLGRYHPHGDASVYDAMVRLAQDFSMRYPLVDGHGNFGSVDGDPPAAYRYTESKMSKLSMHMLTDIDKETVAFQGNYDDRLKEPTVLPSRFPNMLVNGSMGIAVGMATNIPPHNLGETIDAVTALIDNPELEISDLMQYIKGPDFPTAGLIMGYSGIKAAYHTGRGKIYMRARTEIKEKSNGRFYIDISELPYQVNKAGLIKNIAQLVKDKKIDGISNINDYTSREGMKVIIDLKRDANPQVVLNKLFDLTAMQTTFGVNMLALVNGVPEILNLKQILNHYIDFQAEIIYNRTVFNLKKAEKRAHILDGLLIALQNIDEVIELIKKSPDQPTAKLRLIETFELDELQASAILKMTFGQLTGLEREKLENELKDIQAKIEYYNSLLADHNKILGVVKDEILEIREKFADERKTEILNVSGEVDIEDLIPEEECIFTLTDKGYIKRQSIENYRIQNRGGRGITGVKNREEDVTNTMFNASSHDFILFFTDKGRIYKIKGYEVPESSRTGKGSNIVNLLMLDTEEKVTTMLRIPPETEISEHYLCMFTKNGIIKRSRLDEYNNIRKTGIIAINLDDDDVLTNVKLTTGDNHIFVATRNGKSIRFKETDARVIGRTARGVKAIDLDKDDEVIAASVLREDAKVLTVSETGFGRKSEIDNYRLQSRGGKGLINYKTEKYGKVAGVKTVDEDDEIMALSENGIIIRINVSQISTFARPSKGVKIMNLDDGDRLISISRIVSSDEQEEHEESEESSED
ncbi:MAG: DNA gyrase subunit A [Clostridia bacterium]|nr:DNA gyrase subunit A [Clostridia bacterium]